MVKPRTESAGLTLSEPEELKPVWKPRDWIAAAALVLTLLATLYPARSATRITPVEVLRYE